MDALLIFIPVSGQAQGLGMAGARALGVGIIRTKGAFILEIIVRLAMEDLIQTERATGSDLRMAAVTQMVRTNWSRNESTDRV
jgi:hypothetical protein